MTQEELEQISDDEWENVMTRLLHCFGQRYKEDVFISEGKNIEDVIIDTLGDLIRGNRKYYPEKGLYWSAYWAVKSNLNKLFNAADYTKRQISESNDDYNDIYENDEFCELPGSIDSDDFLNEVQKEICGDDDLELIVLSILDDGAKTPKEIAIDTGLPVLKIYELKRKLGRKLKKVQQKLLNDTCLQVIK